MTETTLKGASAEECEAQLKKDGLGKIELRQRFGKRKLTVYHLSKMTNPIMDDSDPLSRPEIVLNDDGCKVLKGSSAFGSPEPPEHNSIAAEMCSNIPPKVLAAAQRKENGCMTNADECLLRRYAKKFEGKDIQEELTSKKAK